MDSEDHPDPDLTVGFVMEMVIGITALGVGITLFVLQRNWLHAIGGFLGTGLYLLLCQTLLFPRIAWKTIGLTVGQVHSAVFVPFILDIVFLVVLLRKLWDPSMLVLTGAIILVVLLNGLSVFRIVKRESESR